MRKFIIGMINLLIALPIIGGILYFQLSKGPPLQNIPQVESGEPSSKQVQEFYRILRSELAAGGDGSHAREYILALPLDQRLEAARAIASDPDLQISTLGMTLLIEACHEDEAVPTLAAMVANGQDLTPIGYSWAHSEDKALALRMYIKISRYLLVHLENYRGEQRKRVEQFLSDGGVVNPLKTFSPDAVEQRLKEFEAKLRAQGATTAPPAGKPRCKE